MDDKEQIYDEEISPLMQQMIAICQRHDMPLFTFVQYSEAGACLSSLPGNPEAAVVAHLVAMSQCRHPEGVNVDEYFFWLKKKAAREGHSSIHLDLLGVPTSPPTPQGSDTE